MLMPRVRHRPRIAASALGLSLVELMVGIAVGLFVVAAAAMLVSTQLNDNRRVLLETQLQQDLRATADIITRELRRSGHWENAQSFLGAPPADNPYASVAFDADVPHEVGFTYFRPPSGAVPYGYTKQDSVLRTLLGAGVWQDLTDANTLRITSFNITPHYVEAAAVPVPCPNLCPDGSSDCWPERKLTVRDLVVEIAGEAVSDPTVKRSLRSVVRLRNDLVTSDPSADCPA